MIALALLLVAPIQAQVSTSAISGVVADENGPIPGASVAAVNTQSGFRYETTADNDGRYQIAGLQPGTYSIQVSSPAYKEQSRNVQVLVGQTSTVDFRLTVDALYAENITVVGESTQLLVDTRSPEVSTNITPQQMESLPL
ncbi:MAG TPA: carboxypeptidase-like regulatory domain-containing protein, partial [Thermoanaerobaculia bacterium]